MGKWLLLMVSALTCFLLLPTSSAFGVSSSHASLTGVKSSREGIGRNHQPLHLVPETTELVATAAATVLNAAATVAGDDSWQRMGLAGVGNGGVGIITTAIIVFAFNSNLKEAITSKTEASIGGLRSEIREEFGELKTDVRNLRTTVIAATVVLVISMIAPAVVPVISMM